MSTSSKIGIALGGGAARGWAHIGILKRLNESGIFPDIVAGTSIGAVVGGCYVADKLEELEEFAMSLTRRRVFGLLDFNLAGSGLITGQRLCAQLDDHLSHCRIEEFEKKFVAVATEIGTGHEVWLSRGKLVEAMNASYALPGIFKPVKIGQRWLIDGAIVNPIPVSICRAMGARIVIAINLHKDVFGKGSVIYDHGTEEDMLPAVDEEKPEKTNGRAAVHLLHRQFFGRGESAPGISSVMLEAFNITQDRIARSRLIGDPPDLLLSPMLNEIGLFEFHRAGASIEAGYLAADAMMEDISQIVELQAA
ncbi:MAG: patatin-like phospholipase family protein [Methyloligellaceae bacterium]